MAKPRPWTFNKAECLLISDETIINLTPTQCIVPDLLASGAERVVSNEKCLQY
jgi:DNA-binding response OmpR family regulator